jgi:hypothetical protein
MAMTSTQNDTYIAKTGAESNGRIDIASPPCCFIFFLNKNGVGLGSPKMTIMSLSFYYTTVITKVFHM